MKNQRWIWLGALGATSGVVGGTSPLLARAEIYMSEKQAASEFFPSEKLVFEIIELTPTQVRAIEQKSGQNVRDNKLKLWRGPGKQAVFIDRVVGKHEFITYCVGIDPEGKVRGIEILEYRETFGHQVRGAEWRKQFVGKTKNAPLKLDRDISNISGATLSSAHITSGVKRLLQTYAQIFQAS